MYTPKIDAVVKADVLIIGGGLAGTWAGIGAKDEGAEDVLLVDKAYVSRSGQSPFAAGIFTVFDPEEDDADIWMREMVEAGEYLNDQEWIRLLFEKTHILAKRMDDWGARYGKTIFEKTADGKFLRRRSRGHINTKHNVINSLPMMETMRRKLTEVGVRIMDNVMITDLLTEGGQAIGAIGLSYRDKKSYLFLAKSVVAAASGCGFKSYSWGTRT